MIYIFLAEGFEEIEALTPVDILRRAGQQVCTVGVGGGKIIRGSHGIGVECDLSDAEISPEKMDMIILPGGMPGTLNLEKSPVVQEMIDYAVANGKWVAAICAAPSILGHKGLLSGKVATCFPGFEQELEGAIPGDYVCVDGKTVTARGMGVAAEFALKLVELLTDAQKANALRLSLQCRV